MRKVHWFDNGNDPTSYLLSVAAWLPVTALLLSLDAHDALVLLLMPLFVTVFFVPHDMCLGAVLVQQRRPYSLWTLRAELWLMFGGAVPQAVRLLLVRRKADVDG